MAPLGLALLASFLVTAAVIKVGPKLGFVDLPDGYLKSHDAPAVPLGGLAIFVGVHWAMVAHGSFDAGLFAATLIVFVLGLTDDRFDLDPRLRLGVEAIAGFVLAVVSNTPALPEGPSRVVLGVLIVVVAINAVNLFDGLDGLVGASAFVAAIALGLMATIRGVDDRMFGLILAMAILGFLIFNWNPAKVFLGDNGSYSLAVFLVYGALNSSPRASEVEVVVAAALLGVFVVDLAVTLLRRKSHGVALFTGDRSHVYDQLRDRGLSVRGVSVRMAIAQVGLAAVIIGIDVVLAPVTALGAIVLTVGGVIGALDSAGFIRPSQRVGE